MRRRTQTALLLAAAATLALLALAACGGVGPRAATPTPHFAAGTPLAHPCPTGGGGAARIWLLPDLSLDGGRLEFRRGEPISMTLSITNCSTVQVHRFYRDSQRYDFIVTDASGREVWRWSHDKLFAQVLGDEVFQSVAYMEVWDQRSNEGEQVPSGRYEVTGLDVGELDDEVGIHVFGCEDESLQDCDLGSSLDIEITP